MRFTKFSFLLHQDLHGKHSIKKTKVKLELLTKINMLLIDNFYDKNKESSYLQ